MKFLSFVLALLVSFNMQARADSMYMLNIPIGWGDHSNREICKRIIETAGVNCGLSVIAVQTSTAQSIPVTYLQVFGGKGDMEKSLTSDFSPFPLKEGNFTIADVLNDLVPETPIRGNRCLAAKVKAGCRCADPGFGPLIFDCDEEQPTNPWEIPDLGLDVSTLIPQLPNNGSLIRLLSRSNVSDMDNVAARIMGYSSAVVNDCGIRMPGCTCYGTHFVCDDGSRRHIP